MPLLTNMQWFDHLTCSTCVATKKCLDTHLLAYEKKIMMDMTDMLEECSLMGSDNLESSQSKEMEDSWCDFQQA